MVGQDRCAGSAKERSATTDALAAQETEDACCAEFFIADRSCNGSCSQYHVNIDVKLEKNCKR
jgi:hypothetical protein